MPYFSYSNLDGDMQKDGSYNWPASVVTALIPSDWFTFCLVI